VRILQERKRVVKRERKNIEVLPGKGGVVKGTA